MHPDEIAFLLYLQSSQRGEDDIGGDFTAGVRQIKMKKGNSRKVN